MVLKEYFQNVSITYKITCPCTHEINPIVEIDPILLALADIPQNFGSLILKQ